MKLTVLLLKFLPEAVTTIGAEPKNYGNDYRPILPWLVAGGAFILTFLLVMVFAIRRRK